MFVAFATPSPPFFAESVALLQPEQGAKEGAPYHHAAPAWVSPQDTSPPHP